MANRGTRLYVSDQEIVASQRTAGASQTQHNVHKPKPLVKLRKGDPAAKQAVDNTGDIRPDGGDAALPLQEGSPWKRYREVLSLLDLGDKVVVACERSDPRKRVNIRRDAHTSRLFGKMPPTAFRRRSRDHHGTGEPRQPCHITSVSSPPQILDGLAYLESRGFCHGALSCNSVLVNALGDVKIGACD